MRLKVNWNFSSNTISNRLLLCNNLEKTNFLKVEIECKPLANVCLWFMVYTLIIPLAKYTQKSHFSTCRVRLLHDHWKMQQTNRLRFTNDDKKETTLFICITRKWCLSVDVENYFFAQNDAITINWVKTCLQRFAADRIVIVRCSSFIWQMARGNFSYHNYNDTARCMLVTRIEPNVNRYCHYGWLNFVFCEWTRMCACSAGWLLSNLFGLSNTPVQPYYLFHHRIAEMSALYQSISICAWLNATWPKWNCWTFRHRWFKI